MEFDELLKKCDESNNFTIYTSLCKAQRILLKSYTPICSISGGADSDIVLDLMHKVDEDGKVRYIWIDTGLEYTATKEHLAELEKKYGITIERVKPDKPIPTCVKEYGVPFLSKYVSEQMMRLQKHNFQWEDEPLEVLLQKYPNCKTSLQWWCNAYYTAENGVQHMSRFSINRNKWLKEFIMQNPLISPFPTSAVSMRRKSLQSVLSRNLMQTLILRVSAKLRAVFARQHTKPVFLSARQKAVIHIALFSGILTRTSMIMRKCLMSNIHAVTRSTG